MSDQVSISDSIVTLPSYEEATAPQPSDPLLPQPSHITAHLKLLFAFHKLRQNVLADSTLFGIDDSWLPISGPACNEDVLNARKIIVEKRWEVYVTRAVYRFEMWWRSLQRQMGSQGITVKDLTFQEPFKPGQRRSTDFAVARGDLPPLDVLMVWHSFLLSPQLYQEDCLTKGMMSLWRVDFPWSAIDQAIDLEQGTYTPAIECEKRFAAICSWSNENDKLARKITCPRCTHESDEVDCTRFPNWIAHVKAPFEKRSLTSDGLSKQLNEAIRYSKGWADPGFSVPCLGCGEEINNDMLCAGKFINDVTRYQDASPEPRSSTFNLSYLHKYPPMPGSVLDPRTGLVNTCYSQHPAFVDQKVELFPIVLAETISHINSQGETGDYPGWIYSMEGVRLFLRSVLSDPQRMLYATNRKQKRADKLRRITVRRMMSYYNDNPSIFSLDLASAVHRQSTFIEKMQHIDWLHSPALSTTAARVITKYKNFMTMIKTEPDQMFVPTLDVDLAWHTHQLTPSSYWSFSVQRTSRFIDHDDKVSSHKLSDSFARTSKIYQRMFNEPYSECTCWYCEAMHASIPKHPGRFMLPGRSNGYRRPAHAPNDHTAAHISTHNVVRVVDSQIAYEAKVRSHMVWLEKAYQRACERAKKEGRTPPARRHLPVDPTVNGSISSKTAGIVAGGVGIGALGMGFGAIALMPDGSVDFGHDAQDITPRGAGGCVGGTCGGGVGWGGGTDDNGGVTGACGSGGGSACAMGGGIGGVGVVGACGG